MFLMQLFNFTPLKGYDLCAGALALTLGGPEVGVLRDWAISFAIGQGCHSSQLI